MPRNSDPRRLLRKAIDATGLSDRQFAMTWLFINERTLRYWLAGGSRIPGPVRIIRCFHRSFMHQSRHQR